MGNKTVVVSLGGSMIINGSGVHLVFLKKIRHLIIREVSHGFRFIIVCGGGNTARIYQAAGRALQFHDRALDMIGIRATHMNAEFVRALFAGVRGVSVCGGERPGASTDAVSVRHAARTGASLVINISNTAFVYDSDPAKNPAAKKFDALTWQQYRAIIGSRWTPGMHAPFDPVAARLAHRHHLTVAFMSGEDLLALPKILLGKKWKGTHIQ